MHQISHLLNIGHHIIVKMRAIIIISLLLIANFNSQAQEIKNGYIIEESKSALGVETISSQRFTPSQSDVDLAEKIVLDNKRNIKRLPIYKMQRPGVFCHYNKYFRQYVGFIDQSGNKIILINYIRDKQLIKKEDVSEIISVLDGGNRFWYAVVNLQQQDLIKVNINRN